MENRPVCRKKWVRRREVTPPRLSAISGRDRLTRKLTPLFNPRRHKWSRHFRWEGARLVGRTPIGRVTVEVLNVNDPFRVELREELMEEGLFPPA